MTKSDKGTLVNTKESAQIFRKLDIVVSTASLELTVIKKILSNVDVCTMS